MANSKEQKEFDPNANRPLPSRPLPERWERFQSTEVKQNKREQINTLSAKNTSTSLPTTNPVKTFTIINFQRMKLFLIFRMRLSVILMKI